MRRADHVKFLRTLMCSVVAVFAAWACAPSNDLIGEKVKSLFQQTLDEKAELQPYHIKVEKVDVIHESGNKYRGIAKVSMSGTMHDVPLSILADSDQIMYEASPGGLAFVAQEAIKRATSQVAEEMRAATKALADNTIQQYNIAKRSGNAIDACIQAGVVAATFLQTNDEGNYAHWKETERTDCSSAGIPR